MLKSSKAKAAGAYSFSLLAALVALLGTFLSRQTDLVAQNLPATLPRSESPEAPAPNGLLARQSTAEVDPDTPKELRQDDSMSADLLRGLQAELRSGIEYDSNALRVQATDTRGDFLTRIFAVLQGVLPTVTGGTLGFEIHQGAKAFLEVDEANTLLTQASLVFQQPLDEVWSAGVALDFKDRTENQPRWDYTRAGASLNIRGNLRSWSWHATSGWRLFAFKPNPDVSSSGFEARTGLRFRPVSSASIDVHYLFADRQFSSAQRVTTPIESSAELAENAVAVTSTANTRRDAFHGMGVRLGWSRTIIAQLSYFLSLNRSNSYGQDITRHSLQATLTAPLLWGWFGTLHAEVQRTLYQDPILIDANFFVDEDNRNALVISVAHPIGDNWEFETRYSLFLQEFGVGDDYERQMLLTGIGYRFD